MHLLDPERRCGSTVRPRRAGSNGPRLEKLTRASNGPIYLADSDPIEFCHLRRRHPVARQGADAAELREGYLAGPSMETPGRPMSEPAAPSST